MGLGRNQTYLKCISEITNSNRINSDCSLITLWVSKAINLTGGPSEEALYSLFYLACLHSKLYKTEVPKLNNDCYKNISIISYNYAEEHDVFK